MLVTSASLVEFKSWRLHFIADRVIEMTLETCVVLSVTTDMDCIEAFRWSLGLISKMLVRTIQEGSTIVMKAINSNSAKALRKAISCAPRGDRSDWQLLIQVGTRSISPLAWSIESGALESAQAIIPDLMTFRADCKGLSCLFLFGCCRSLKAVDRIGAEKGGRAWPYGGIIPHLSILRYRVR